MKLQFTDHAQYRIFYERNISAEQIKMVISGPDSSEKIQNDLIKSKKLLDKRTLIVVYSREGNEYLIITAYFQ
ncbi:MAG: DUF4258 domain-containing protein [Candidatus Zambryskibacteria bacterium]|nr:DUF4258 domain-containing protein [Candidatus Zambryskibacteria bacterium]